MNEDAFDTSVRKLPQEGWVSPPQSPVPGWARRICPYPLYLPSLSRQTVGHAAGSKVNTSRLIQPSLWTALSSSSVARSLSASRRAFVIAASIWRPRPSSPRWRAAQKSKATLLAPIVARGTGPRPVPAPRNFERVIVGAQISVDHALAGRGDRYQFISLPQVAQGMGRSRTFLDDRSDVGMARPWNSRGNGRLSGCQDREVDVSGGFEESSPDPASLRLS